MKKITVRKAGTVRLTWPHVGLLLRRQLSHRPGPPRTGTARAEPVRPGPHGPASPYSPTSHVRTARPHPPQQPATRTSEADMATVSPDLDRPVRLTR